MSLRRRATIAAAAAVLAIGLGLVAHGSAHSDGAVLRTGSVATHGLAERGLAKSAMVRIQADEYGEGRPGRSHAELFATTMDRLGLDPTPGACVDDVPGVTLATDNLASMFGLHRALRGSLVGHLAVFEMTSVVPMGRYASAIRRLADDDLAAEFYDVHVEADAEHR